jgi:hypothetical protein
MIKLKFIKAQTTSEDIEKALLSKDVLIGAEWEFFFNQENILKPRNLDSSAIEQLEKAIKSPINISPWLNKKAHTYKDISGWKLEYEDSLRGERGAELISPPLPLQKFLKIYPQVFETIDKVGKTTDACGFHVGISTRKISKINPLKLIFFIDENLVYSVFNKEARSIYGGPVKEIIIDALREKSINIKDITKLETALEASLQSELSITLTKDYGINPGKLQSGYVEFRYMGGKDYHKKWDKIRDIIGMYIFILKMACDKDYKKEEYKEKVSELLKGEVEKQKVLIEDTKPWVKPIKEFLKYYNLKTIQIRRSSSFIYVHLSGLQEDMNKITDYVEYKIDNKVLKISASDLVFKKFLDDKMYKKMKERFNIKNNTVIDNHTNLMWVRRIFKKMKWQEALSYCEKLKLDNYKDWRLPTLDELLTLVKKGSLPTIDTKIFPDMSQFERGEYTTWTSTKVANSSKVQCLSFGDGSSFPLDNSYKLHFFAVRSKAQGKSL